MGVAADYITHVIESLPGRRIRNTGPLRLDWILRRRAGDRIQHETVAVQAAQLGDIGMAGAAGGRADEAGTAVGGIGSVVEHRARDGLGRRAAGNQRETR